jgi:hypothetical protein
MKIQSKRKDNSALMKLGTNLLQEEVIFPSKALQRKVEYTSQNTCLHSSQERRLTRRAGLLKF